ncbi:YcnI family copper-binding membrane protein [Nocardia brevicatena]|uniref:YcnI family copper-binding membrane protein n=1 Tax=Nocardia brevicatena TaxID=37327 RepID=UPI00030C388B|nr:YcnI family protein [Nocardia brevicatena]
MHSPIPHALARWTAAAALGTGLAVLGAGPAAAHVTVDAPDAAQGQMTIATFRVPTESETADTTAVTVAVPQLQVALTEPLPGWTAEVERNDKSQVTAIIWKTAAGNPGIAPGQFQRFAVTLGPLPQQETVSFPATQTYSDGKVVRWAQADEDGSASHPAPSLILAAGANTGHHGENTNTAAASGDTGTDTTARWLGGAGLAVGVLGLGLGVGSMIRGRR